MKQATNLVISSLKNVVVLLWLQHFVDNEPTAAHPDPIPASPYDRKVVTPARKRPASRVFTPPSTKKRVIAQDAVSSGTDVLLEAGSSLEACDGLLLLGNSQLQSQDPLVNTSAPGAADPASAQSTHDAVVEDSCFINCENCGHSNVLKSAVVRKLNRRAFVSAVQSSDAQCFYYTGIPTVALLLYLFTWLKASAQNIKLWDGNRKGLPRKTVGRKRAVLTRFQEFLLVLVRIRQGFDTAHVSYLFGVSQSHVCRVFSAWVIFLHHCIKPLIVWPSQSLVKSNLPNSFKRYPRTRCIIDCTEYYVQKPFRPVAQKQTWSNYKQSNTFKQLIGIMPSGAITFLSKLYSGNISDLAIVKESKFIDLVEEGDDIMADRGFNIRHLLLPKKATLNIPSFSHGKKLSVKAVRRSRNIATVRIHVERAIRRMKMFKILSGIIPLKL